MEGNEKGSVLASQFFIGLDLGQAQDPSAIAVLERAELVGDWAGAEYAHTKVIELRLRWLERLPLGLKYPEVERRVEQVVAGVAPKGQCELLVDATGVGRPVVDHLRANGPGCGMRAVMVTSGHAEKSEKGFDYVPKRDLMAGLQMLFEYGELKIAKTLRHVETLKKEMAEMRVRVTPSGNEQFGAWRQGQHDDLVFAVALACWGAGKRYPGKLSGAVGYWLARDLRGFPLRLVGPGRAGWR